MEKEDFEKILEKAAKDGEIIVKMLEDMQRAGATDEEIHIHKNILRFISSKKALRLTNLKDQICLELMSQSYMDLLAATLFILYKEDEGAAAIFMSRQDELVAVMEKAKGEIATMLRKDKENLQ